MATVYELLERCGKKIDADDPDDAKFLAECQRVGVTPDQVARRYVLNLQQRIRESKQQAEMLERERTIRQRIGRSHGVTAVGTKQSGPTRSSSFSELVQDLVRSGKSRADAVRTVARQHPELHRQYVAEAN